MKNVYKKRIPPFWKYAVLCFKPLYFSLSHFLCFTMDKENRFKLSLPRFFKSSYASCRSRILSDTTTTTNNNNLPSSQPIIPPSSQISSTSFRSVSKPTHSSSKSNSHALFYYPQFPASASPVSSLILDREFYHKPNSKKQSKTKHNHKKKMEKNERRFSSRSRRLAHIEIQSSTDDDDDVFFSSRSRSSSDSSNETLTMKDNVVAVVKSSNDPYEDFRTSMVEMIVEKQIMNLKDLEMLLQSFLELNSRHHHRVILNVFVEILEALFGQCD